jgi:hypothetical protein
MAPENTFENVPQTEQKQLANILSLLFLTLFSAFSKASETIFSVTFFERKKKNFSATRLRFYFENRANINLTCPTLLRFEI